MEEPAEAGIPDTRDRLLVWYETSARDLPWRRTSDPYAILVSEIMLQQTQVDRVIPKYHEFLALFPSFASLASASMAAVIRAWSPLGYNRRAVNLHRIAVVVLNDFGGTLPKSEEVLRALPGIGRYTAAAIRCFAFGEPDTVVDTNIRRVLRRLSPAAGASETAVFRTAARYLPPSHAGPWSQALMDLGATICTAAATRCLLCPLAEICPSRGRHMREARAHYTTRTAKEPFRSSDRFLRGRIVDLLRRVGTRSVDELVTAPEIVAAAPDRARIARLVLALERDRLVQIAGADGALVSLPGSREGV